MLAARCEGVLFRAVPPTPVAHGSEAGSSTESIGNPKQSYDPSSPEAANTEIPATAASSSA